MMPNCNYANKETTMTAIQKTKAAVNKSAIFDLASIKSAIVLADKVVEKRNTIPVLSNFLITQSGKVATIKATDLDLMVSIDVPVEEGKISPFTCVADDLKKIVMKAAPGSNILISEDVDQTLVQIGPKVKVWLNRDAEVKDFPEFDMGEKPMHYFSLTVGDLCEAFKNVQPAISTEETRYYLNGIYAHESAGQMIFVATDGHRLLKKELPAPKGAKDMFGSIIPRKAVKFLIDCMKGMDVNEYVTIRSQDAKMEFSGGNWQVITKLIDGNFPDYTRVIPAAIDTPAVFTAGQISSSLDQAIVLASERGRAVALRIGDGEGATITCKNPEKGETKVEVECFYKGEWMEIGFNSSYLKEIVSILAPAGGEVSLNVTNPGAPTLITGENDGLCAVLMPVRI